MPYIFKYEPKTKWAGLVWIWGHTLNQIPKDGFLEIIFEGNSVVMHRNEIKSKIVREKKLFNNLTKKEDTQYGFAI